ncbi:hypothetical protein [Mycolicibacterium mageritense]|uniref:hypothetical protein n=1 Tax=Mycolicibacterium mageritense TaxID=53462 RepID=UPI0023EFC6C4|nr:hypothetical protein [Mycolicibacterium mageritense]
MSTNEYLNLLVANGYQLSDIERVMVGELNEDDLYDQTVAAESDKNEATIGGDGTEE